MKHWITDDLDHLLSEEESPWKNEMFENPLDSRMELNTPSNCGKTRNQKAYKPVDTEEISQITGMSFK